MSRFATFVLWLVVLPAHVPAAEDRIVRVPLSADGELDLVPLLKMLGEATSARVAVPGQAVAIPLRGPGAALSRTLLGEAFGKLADVKFGTERVEIRIRDGSDPGGWQIALARLSEQAAGLLQRRAFYGLRALRSYRSGDPSRPTVCLIHGLNSSSGVFKHLIPVIESAGFGVVVYDFPANQDLDKSSRAFVRDWLGFRDSNKDSRPWAILSHSMGGLLVRYYVEGKTIVATCRR